MSNEGKTVIPIAGKFPPTEEAVLEFLYEHPTGWGTFYLVRDLRPDRDHTFTDEQKTKAFDEVQYAIETLVAAKLVKGKRLRAPSGKVYFEELELTTSGEGEAIKQKRRIKAIVTNVKMPHE